MRTFNMAYYIIRVIQECSHKKSFWFTTKLFVLRLLSAFNLIRHFISWTKSKDCFFTIWNIWIGMKTKQKVKMVLFQLSYAEEFIWKNSDQITRRTTQTNPKERERERARLFIWCARLITKFVFILHFKQCIQLFCWQQTNGKQCLHTNESEKIL